MADTRTFEEFLKTIGNDFGDRTEAACRDYEKFLDDLSKQPESAETMTPDEFMDSLRDDSEDKPTY
jgi:hypothetical protein